MASSTLSVSSGFMLGLVYFLFAKISLNGIRNTWSLSGLGGRLRLAIGKNGRIQSAFDNSRSGFLIILVNEVKISLAVYFIS